MSKKPQKYQLASSKKFMEKESSGFTATFLKIPQGVSIYQLKKGKALLDVIPYVVGKGNPNADEGMLYWERPFFIHRNVGPNQATYICPARTINKPCPVCDDRARMMKSGDDEDMVAAKELNAKEWQLIQLQDRNDSEKGIQLLPLSYYRFGEALKDAAAAGDEEDHWETFWHPSGGKSLRVQWDEDSMGSQKFIRAKTVLFKDRDDLDDELIESGHCLDDLLIIHDYKKLKSIYTAGSPDDAEEEETEEEEAPVKSKRPEPEDEEPQDEEGEEEMEEVDEEEASPKKKKKIQPEPEKEEEDEDADEAEEAEDEEPAPKKKSKSGPEPEDEPDEQDEEEAEEEDADEEPDETPPLKKKKKVVEEDDEEEAEEEDDEQETPRGGKFRTASDKDAKRAKEGSVKKKSKDEEPDDWDGFDDADETPEDEEEEDAEASPKKKKK